MSSITLKGIAYRPKPGMAMHTRQSCQISTAHGVLGDSRGNLSIRKSNKRQVSVLSEESWQEALNFLNSNEKQPSRKNNALVEPDLFSKTLHWSARRANLLISGKIFSAQDIGTRLHIGDVVLEITCETDPCSKMDSIQAGLRKALEPNWRGGACTKVIQGGEIRIGDSILIKNSNE